MMLNSLNLKNDQKVQKIDFDGGFIQSTAMMIDEGGNRLVSHINIYRLVVHQLPSELR